MKTSKGFSLLEVIIALGIMASVMMVLTSSWRGNFNRVKKAEIKTEAVFLLQKKVTEIEVFYRTQVKSLPKEKQSGTFKENKKYSWEWEARDFKMPDIAKLFLKEEGLVDEMSLTVINKMKTYLEESIKELKVTLIYKDSKNAKPLKYSVSTILVDYNTEINLGFNPQTLGGQGGN